MSDYMESDPGIYYWYTLRVFGNEERCVASIKEHVELRKLQKKIVEVKILEEYQIVESEDYFPSSDDLPKRGFKNTSTSVWVRVSSGNYRKIKAVKRKPFGGMIFIKMVHDHELFKMIRSWDAGFSFLGGNQQPQVMSDSDFRRTEESLNKEAPDLSKYIEDKHYLLVEGPLNIHRDVPQMDLNQEDLSDSEDDIEEQKDIPMKSSIDKEPEDLVDSVESRKAQIYSELKIKEYEGDFSSISSTPKSKGRKHGQQFSVNDFVFVAHLGFKGVIQEIDYSKDHVIVGVQMFGRRQPVECKISEISSV